MKTIAFIPVRGGSKSIPLKNIKPLCGKPLVCWNIEALEACRQVDEIIVATDSDTIEETVSQMNYRKTKVYRRLAQNATDTATTESVMLEYINQVEMVPETVFMLVQATSPLTQTIHFEEALERYAAEGVDSMLSCVHSKRFFWNADGTSVNYDYHHRPRRQDFDGMLMENGAFYISTVANIIKSGNRLSGRIGLYEMPAYTALEIDEPDDWTLMESLMRRHIVNSYAKVETNQIKLFLCDVDGTLTDGGMYYSENGDELKKFDTRDGMAFELLRERGIKTGILTSESTKVVERRAAKLKVDFLKQGVRGDGKLAAAQEICDAMGITLREVAYMGDDRNCVDLLSNVGFAACPADACKEVLAIEGIHVANRRGGDAALRAVVEKWLLD